MSYFVTSDGVRIAYQIHGPYDGQVLVFSTGYAASQGNWCLQVDYFSTHGYRVVTYDHRNQGDSQTSYQNMTIARHGQDLRELLTQCHLDEVVLIGHSLGAATIWSYLTQYGQTGIKAVVTEDMPAKTIQSSSWPVGLLAADQQHLLKAVKKLPTVHLTVRSLPLALKERLAETVKPFNYQANQTLLIDSLEQDWRPTLAQETLPHLIIMGERSPLWPDEAGELTVRFLVKGQLVVIPGVGHVPHLEVADQYNQILLEFLKGL